jgi:dolichol-phosphate mannosyltransferase
MHLNRTHSFLICLGLFPIAVFAALSLIRASKLNWTGPCWIALLPFLALVLTHKSKTSKFLSRINAFWPSTLLILMLFYGGAMHFLGIGLPYVKYPQNTHLMGFDGLGKDIQQITEDLEKEKGKSILVVGMDRNKIASGLAFYRTKSLKDDTQHPSYKTASEHLFGGIGLMYELWFPIKEQYDKPMLLVGESIEELDSAEVLSRVNSAGPITAIKAKKADKITGQYYYRLIEGYHPPIVAN